MGRSAYHIIIEMLARRSVAVSHSLTRCFAAKAGDSDVPSFGRQLFLGRISLPAVYPYPEVSRQSTLLHASFETVCNPDSWLPTDRVAAMTAAWPVAATVQGSA